MLQARKTSYFREDGPIDIMGCIFSDKALMRQMSFVGSFFLFFSFPRLLGDGAWQTDLPEADDIIPPGLKMMNDYAYLYP